MLVLLIGNASIFNHEDHGWGGIETTLKALRKYLLLSGHEVEVVTIVLGPGPSRTISPPGERGAIWLDKTNPLKRIWPAFFVKKELGEIIDRFKPDVIWSRNVQVGLIADRLARCPVFQIFPHLAHIAYLWNFSKDNMTSSNGQRDPRTWIVGTYRLIRRSPSLFLEKWLEKKAVRKLRLVVLSQNMRQQIMKTHSIPEEAVRVINPGVDAEIFNPQSGRGQFKVIQDRYGLTKDEKFILFVGRLVKGKNIPLLIKAMTLTRTESRLVIVGDGPMRGELERNADELGLSSRVLFAGRQDELLPGFYSMARVFVNPCLLEPFGHVFIESLSCGTPVIGIESDGSKTMTAIDEVTAGGQYGRGVKAIPEAMAMALDEILSLNDGAYRTLSEGGSGFVKANYQWPDFIDQMMRLLVCP